MNGHKVDGIPLYVAPHKSKEDRQTEQQQQHQTNNNRDIPPSQILPSEKKSFDHVNRGGDTKPRRSGTRESKRRDHSPSGSRSRPQTSTSTSRSSLSQIPPIAASYTCYVAEEGDTKERDNYKTVQCRRYQQGLCERGDGCTFAHGFKDVTCKSWLKSGSCNIKNCKYRHDR